MGIRREPSMNGEAAVEPRSSTIAVESLVQTPALARTWQSDTFVVHEPSPMLGMSSDIITKGTRGGWEMEQALPKCACCHGCRLPASSCWIPRGLYPSRTRRRYTKRRESLEPEPVLHESVKGGDGNRATVGHKGTTCPSAPSFRQWHLHDGDAVCSFVPPMGWKTAVGGRT